MRTLLPILLFVFCQACGKAASDGRLLADQPAPTKSLCAAHDDFQICIPHVGQGERLFALVEHGDQGALAKLSQHLAEGLGQAASVPTAIAENFTKAEEEARTLYPARDVIDISASFPEAVRQNFNRLKNFSGPNCYATALMASGLLREDELLYVGLDELQLYFEHYFTEVDQPRFGDVVLYDVKGAKDHAAFYLLDDLVFHKKGYRKGYAFRIAPLTRVFAAEPFEWKPSPVDDEQAKDDPGFGEKPKKFYRLRDPAAASAPQGKEAAAIAVINHIAEQMKVATSRWSVPRDMGTMIEGAITALLKEFRFLAASPSFEARLAYERLHSLESQAFQVIDETLYTSDRADPDKINEQNCLVENEFLNALFKKFYFYRHQTEADAAQITKMLEETRAMDRKSCHFKFGANW